MTYEEFVVAMKEDNNFMRKVAQLYLRFGEFLSIEQELDLECGAFAKIMCESPEVWEKIATTIDTEFEEEQRIASKARIRKALNRLSATVDAVEDESTALKAALGILQFDLKLLRQERKVEEEDDLDKLWREVTSESKTKEDAENSQ